MYRSTQQLDSSDAEIGITVVPVDPLTTDGSHFRYPSDPTNPSSLPNHSGLVKRSRSLTRSPTQRGRPPLRRDSLVPTHRGLSPLNLAIDSSLGPFTEPIFNGFSFDWSSPHNPALLSLPSSSTLESRRKRSASCRSLRAASVSDQPSSTQFTFLSVPDRSSKLGLTRPRSTSVPAEPLPTFYSTTVPTFDPTLCLDPTTTDPQLAFSPAESASLTTSPSISSVHDPDSGSSSSFQLDPTAIYYDIPSSHPSPESPLLLDRLGIYSQSNSSASSLTSVHSVHSVHSQTSQPHSPDPTAFPADNAQQSFDILSDTTGLSFHDNNVVAGFNISDTGSSAAYPADLLQTNEVDLRLMLQLSGPLDPLILDCIIDPLVNEGQGQVASIYGDPFSQNESVLSPSALDTLPHPAPSPGNTEQSPYTFNSPLPTPLDYGNLLDNQASNDSHYFARSQTEPLIVPCEGQHAPSPRSRVLDIALQKMHGALNDQTIIGHRKQSVGPRFGGTRTSTSTAHHAHGAVNRLEDYFHRVQGTSSSGAPINPPSLASHLLADIAHPNMFGTGGISEIVHNAALHTRLVAPPETNHGVTEASARRFTRAAAVNDSDPRFEAKKAVYDILTESTSKDVALEKVTELTRRTQSNLIRSVYDAAEQRKVKSTPASRQKADDRRSRPPTFFCILCQGQFTTNNNLQNHYRSHLQMDQYQCPRCGDYFRTEGIRKRHTDGAQKCRRLEESASTS